MGYGFHTDEARFERVRRRSDTLNRGSALGGFSRSQTMIQQRVKNTAVVSTRAGEKNLMTLAPPSDVRAPRAGGARRARHCRRASDPNALNRSLVSSLGGVHQVARLVNRPTPLRKLRR